jgi:hypothetical protein
MNQDKALHELHEHLGYRPLSRIWAKLEIFLGLSAAGIGLFLGRWAQPEGESFVLFTVAGVVLFVLGGYLTLAGHRSHLYRASNDRTAYLASLIHNYQTKGPSS